MINSSLIHTEELFSWVDDFSKITGLSTFAALQVYAECCYFQDANALLECLISIEAEYKRQLGSVDNALEGDYDIDWDIFFEHQGKYQLTLDSLAEEDATRFADHYEKVLVHHGFNKQFSVYFIEHFHPLSECVTSDSPAVDNRFIFHHQYTSTPFFTEPPEAPVYSWLNIFERLEREPAIDPAGWAAVFKMLGFSGIDSDAEPTWPAYEPSFFLSPSVAEVKSFCEEQGFKYDENDQDFIEIFESIAVYITPIRITKPNMLSWDMLELRVEVENESDTAIVLYSAPYIIRAPDKKNFVSIWGEIFDGDTWKIMPLHANSTSLKIILEDAFIPGAEPNWQKIATPGQPLVELWQKHHGSAEIWSPGANNSEVIFFKPDQSKN